MQAGDPGMRWLAEWCRWFAVADQEAAMLGIAFTLDGHESLRMQESFNWQSLINVHLEGFVWGRAAGRKDGPNKQRQADSKGFILCDGKQCDRGVSCRSRGCFTTNI